MTTAELTWIVSRKRDQAARLMGEINDLIAIHPDITQGLQVDNLRREFYRLREIMPEKI